MSITTSLKTAIYSAIGGDTGITGAVSYYGYGVAPPTTTGDYLTWFLIDDDNGDFMRANTNYYKTVDVQFSAHTDDADSAAAAAIRDSVEALFRFNTLTLSTGRHISTEIGAGSELEDPEVDGWNVTTTLTFEIGT